jgi:hypothetical protein
MDVTTTAVTEIPNEPYTIETTGSEIYSHCVEVTVGRRCYAVSVNYHGKIRVLCKNASHNAWGGAGRGFDSWDDAAAGYKSEAAKVAIKTAREEIENAKASAGHPRVKRVNQKTRTETRPARHNPGAHTMANVLYIDPKSSAVTQAQAIVSAALSVRYSDACRKFFVVLPTGGWRFISTAVAEVVPELILLEIRKATDARREFEAKRAEESRRLAAVLAEKEAADVARDAAIARTASAEKAMPKVPVSKVVFEWSESAWGDDPMEFPAIEDANAQLKIWAEHAPKGGETYDKTKFHITWANGDTYRNGRYDLHHISEKQENPSGKIDLGDHVRSFCDAEMRSALQM